MKSSKQELMGKVKVSVATNDCWEHVTKTVNMFANYFAFGGKTKTVKGNFVVAMDNLTIQECEEFSADAIASAFNYSTKKDGLTIEQFIGYACVAVKNKLQKHWQEKKKYSFVRLPMDTERDCLISEDIVIEQTERVFSVIKDIVLSEDIDSQVADIIVSLALGDKNGGLQEEKRSTRYWKINNAREVFHSFYFADLIKEDEVTMNKLREAKAKRVDEELALTDFVSQLYKYARVIETPEPEVVESEPTEFDYTASLVNLNQVALDKVLEQRPELIKFLD